MITRPVSLPFTICSSLQMERPHIFLLVLSGVVFCSPDWVSGSVLEVTVRPGDNITLYCDCKLSSGVYIVWYRNCSHGNQPSLVLKMKHDSSPVSTTNSSDPLRIFPRFQFVRNYSSDSYDLLIMNITDTDEGLYYCGTEQIKLGSKEYITARDDYRYGNIPTRIRINSSEPDHHETPQATLSSRNCGVCWTLLFSLCPMFAFLSSLLSSIVVYYRCGKKAKKSQRKPETRGQSRLTQDEDVCYAAVEINQPSQRPEKKKNQSSDFCTYSAIKTSRM